MGLPWRKIAEAEISVEQLIEELNSQFTGGSERDVDGRRPINHACSKWNKQEYASDAGRLAINQSGERFGAELKVEINANVFGDSIFANVHGSLVGPQTKQVNNYRVADIIDG